MSHRQRHPGKTVLLGASMLCISTVYIVLLSMHPEWSQSMNKNIELLLAITALLMAVSGIIIIFGWLNGDLNDED